ncbi:MAG: 50S ribosomal protein L11 methyltransferase [Gemmatimonadetes bacterium]|nr:50S ribosomal protein L11 methyltransferase [Gemmatimonadota bacterium]
MSYRVRDYLDMIADERRTGAYVRALRKLVNAESVVLDLGAGFGFFAVLAAKLGARRAFAIETEDAIGLGPALAQANGVDDRVTFLQGDSRQVTLPERANLLVEDVRGVLPLHSERIKLLVDARERLLTPEARLIAVRDRLWAAPAREAQRVREVRAITGADAFGVNLGGLRPHVVDAPHRPGVEPDDLLLPGAPLGTIELVSVSDPNFEGTARWSVPAPLVADGFAVWFDAELAGGERFSSAPGSEQTLHRTLYLPLRHSITAPAGGELSLRFCAVQTAGEYTWVWECAVAGPDGREVVRAARQSSLGALAFTPALLAKGSELHRPSLGLEGRRVQATILLAEAARSVGEIAAALAAQPALAFASRQAAFDWLQRTLPWLEAGSVVQHRR